MLTWLAESKMPPELYEFKVQRSGPMRRQMMAELELRATVKENKPASMELLLKRMLGDLLVDLPSLSEVLKPRPSKQDTIVLVDSLWEMTCRTADMRGVSSTCSLSSFP